MVFCLSPFPQQMGHGFLAGKSGPTIRRRSGDTLSQGARRSRADRPCTRSATRWVSSSFLSDAFAEPRQGRLGKGQAHARLHPEGEQAAGNVRRVLGKLRRQRIALRIREAGESVSGSLTCADPDLVSIRIANPCSPANKAWPQSSLRWTTCRPGPCE